MGKKAFDSIKAGLMDARDYVRGKIDLPTHTPETIEARARRKKNKKKKAGKKGKTSDA